MTTGDDRVEPIRRGYYVADADLRANVARILAETHGRVPLDVDPEDARRAFAVVGSLVRQVHRALRILDDLGLDPGDLQWPPGVLHELLRMPGFITPGPHAALDIIGGGGIPAARFICEQAERAIAEAAAEIAKEAATRIVGVDDP